MRDVNFPESGPGYLVISEADETIRDAATIWIAQEVSLYENDSILDDWSIEAVRLSLPSDQSFRSYATARRHIQEPRLPDNSDLYRDQAMLDVLIRYPIQSRVSRILDCAAVCQVGSADHDGRAFLNTSTASSGVSVFGDPGVVRLDPRWHHAFFRFVAYGVEHILDGIDHLLFVICLLIPFRKTPPADRDHYSFTVPIR